MKTKKIKPHPQAGPSGRYAICPNSFVAMIHPSMVAIQVIVSSKGRLWCYCTCGVRVYFPKKQPPLHTREAVLQAGAVIPSEVAQLMAMPGGGFFQPMPMGAPPTIGPPPGMPLEGFYPDPRGIPPQPKTAPRPTGPARR